MMRTTIVGGVLVALSLAAGSSPAEGPAEKPPVELRVYFVGNSVTDTIRYDGLAKLAASKKRTLTWGRHMIPGAPLQCLWDHPAEGFTQEPFGYPSRAFAGHDWDAVSLQSFDRPLGGDDGDVAKVRQYCELLAKRSPAAQVYLFARWPRVTRGGKSLQFDKDDYDPSKPGNGLPADIDPFDKQWTAKYTGGYDLTNESRDYFDRLLAEARQATPFLTKPIRLVPVGHAMSELDKRMRAGKVPGCETVHRLYKDGIHLNELGSYAVGCAYFATLFGESPVGLPTEPYGSLDPAAARAVQEAVWEVVRVHPESGVK